MSAKEMFEELGYKLILQDKNDIRYLLKDSYTDEIDIEEEKQIIFCINDGIGIYPNKSIIIECLEKHHLSNGWYKVELTMTTQLLKAINKQIEELGWLE